MSKLATVLLLILALCPVAWAAKPGQALYAVRTGPGR